MMRLHGPGKIHQLVFIGVDRIPRMDFKIDKFSL